MGCVVSVPQVNPSSRLSSAGMNSHEGFEPASPSPAGSYKLSIATKSHICCTQDVVGSPDEVSKLQLKSHGPPSAKRGLPWTNQLEKIQSKSSQWSDDSAEVYAGCPTCPGIDPVLHSAVPSNETVRIKALHDLGVIGTPPDPRFDAITSLAKAIFQVKAAAMTLVDVDVIHIHSSAGDFPHKMAPRPGAFCNWLILSKDPTMLIVEDGLKDSRFCKSPHPAAPPNLRFYAGAPLVGSNGHLYGALCVMDRKPRYFRPEQYCLLGHLAEMAVHELERDLEQRRMSLEIEVAAPGTPDESSETLFQRAEDEEHATDVAQAFAAPHADSIVLVDVSRPQWPVIYTNPAWVDTTGESAGHELYSGSEALFWQQFGSRVSDVQQIQQALQAARDGQPFVLKLTPKSASKTDTDAVRKSNDSASSTPSTGKEDPAAPVSVWFVPVGRKQPDMTVMGTARGVMATGPPRVVGVPSGIYMDWNNAPPKSSASGSLSGFSSPMLQSSSRATSSSQAPFSDLDSHKSAALADALAALSGIRSVSSRSSMSFNGRTSHETKPASSGEGEGAALPDFSNFVEGNSSMSNIIAAARAASSIVEMVEHTPSPSSPTAHLAPVFYIGVVNNKPDELTANPNPNGNHPSSTSSHPWTAALQTPTQSQTTVFGWDIPVEHDPFACTRDSADSVNREEEEQQLRRAMTGSGSGSSQGGVYDQGGAVLTGLRGGMNCGKVGGDCGCGEGDELEGVSLGPLISSRPGVCCFRGTWQGSKVAVTVMQRFMTCNTPSLVTTALANLCHPHILPTFAHAIKDQLFKDNNGTPCHCRQIWLVQEFSSKGSLLDALEKGELKQDGRANMSALLRTAHEVASAMAYAHSKNVCHGALTSREILLSITSTKKDARGWVAKVDGFSWDAPAVPTPRVSHDNSFAGTGAGTGEGSQSMARADSGNNYTVGAEERSSGSADATTNSTRSVNLAKSMDVLGFGIILWEMYHGRRAFVGATDLGAGGIEEGIHLQIPKEVPAKLKVLMQKCLATNPSSRPSFKAIVKELERPMGMFAGP